MTSEKGGEGVSVGSRTESNAAATAVPARVPVRARGRRTVPARLWGVIIGLVIVCAYLTITTPLFMTWGNLVNIFRAQSVVAILAIGMTFVILTGGLDLSIASLTGLSAMLFGLAMQAGWTWIPAVLLCIAVGTFLGMINGLLIGWAKISFFVVTLGTLSIYQSMALLSNSGTTISLFSYKTFTPIQDIANSSIGPIPVIAIIVAILYLLASFVLHYTSFGRAIYATGSNAEAARLNGINVALILVSTYTISGLTGGLGAIQQTGRLTATSPVIDPGLMLTVVAAVLIEGMSLRGGEGGLLGTLLGVIFLGVIQNGLSLSGVSTFWQGTVTGLILIMAVGLAQLRQTKLRGKIERYIHRRRAGADG